MAKTKKKFARTGVLALKQVEQLQPCTHSYPLSTLKHSSPLSPHTLLSALLSHTLLSSLPSHALLSSLPSHTPPISPLAHSSPLSPHTLLSSLLQLLPPFALSVVRQYYEQVTGGGGGEQVAGGTKDWEWEVVAAGGEGKDAGGSSSSKGRVLHERLGYFLAQYWKPLPEAIGHEQLTVGYPGYVGGAAGGGESGPSSLFTSKQDAAVRPDAGGAADVDAAGGDADAAVGAGADAAVGGGVGVEGRTMRNSAADEYVTLAIVLALGADASPCHVQVQTTGLDRVQIESNAGAAYWPGTGREAGVVDVVLSKPGDAVLYNSRRHPHSYSSPSAGGAGCSFLMLHYAQRSYGGKFGQGLHKEL
jgi:hypothetical protein